MRIKNTGQITWNPSGIYKISCESDITYYPLNSQFCTIIVSTWGYTLNEIRLQFQNEPINIKYYSENGEWELISTSTNVASSRSRDGETFSSLEFNVSLRRRPLFHILNTLFPVSLMAILIAMVFRLPADSRENIGFSLTVLLAYAVYLTLISVTIPSTSMKVCYLTVYLALTLALGTIAVIFTIVVLEVHFKPEEEEIPPWIITMSRECMARIVCWKRKGCYQRNCKVRPATEDNIRIVDTITNKEPLSLEDISSSSKSVSDSKDIQTNFNEEILLPTDILSHSEEPKDEKEFTWKDVSAVLDKFFFVSYICIVLVATAVLWLTTLFNYLTLV